MKLRIAAKVDAADRDYFVKEIEPLLSQPHVEFVGEIGNPTSANSWPAHALLFPIDWPEPFGLVLIEAMSCGRRAWLGVPDPSRKSSMRASMASSSSLSKMRLRRCALRRDRSCSGARIVRNAFHVQRMTRDYLDLYRRLAMGRSRSAAA
jgi:glycosyltransferase involved in cell wall biosynthesis